MIAMADLDEIASSLNVKLPPHSKAPNDNGSSKATGQKRRSWLINEATQLCEEDKKGVYRPLKEEASVVSSNSTRSNRLDSQKGPIKGVYRPLNLSLEELRGNPLRITKYLFKLSKHTATRNTEKVTLLEIMNTLVISRDSARTGLRFLLRNKLVERTEFRAGKSGWSKYKLKIELFTELDEKGFIDPF